MWNLFKEAFRSLKKNKVVVVGLSILVFLVSLIFTLLYDLKTTMTTQFNNYKKVSKLHDVTVDLNLSNQGSPYKNGYTNNGKLNDDSNFDTPKKFSLDLSKWTNEYIDSTFTSDIYRANVRKMINDLKNKEKSLILQIKNDSSFIQLSNLNKDSSKPIPDEYKDLYIKKEEILNLFNLYTLINEVNQGNNLVDFNLKEQDLKNSYFKFINLSNPNIEYSPTYDLYEKKDNDFQKYKKILSINKNQNIQLDKTYKLEDIFSLSKQIQETTLPDGTIEKKTNYYVSQIASMFINYETSEATFEFTKGKNWIENKKGKIVDTSVLMKLLGFEPFKNKNNEVVEHLYQCINFDKTVAAQFINLTNPNEYSKEDTLKMNFSFASFNMDNTIEGVEQKITLQENKQYSIPAEWIFSHEVKVEFARWFYETTFNRNQKSKEDPNVSMADKWTDEYYNFMNEIEKPNNEETKKFHDYFWSFSYWKQFKTALVTPFDADGKLDYSKTESKELIVNLTNENDYLLLKQIDLVDNGTKIGSIEEIESKSTSYSSIEKLFDQIIDEKILSTRLIKLKEVVSTRTRNKVIEKIKNNVLAKHSKNPEQFIGLRQTMTIDGLDDKNKKQIYHFINIGDKDKKVLGIELNVGKLFEEQSKNSQIYGWNTTNFFKSPQINPIVAARLIQAYSQNLFSDPKYIEPEYHYGTMIDNNYEQNIYIERKNTKIIQLSKWLENAKDSDGNLLPQLPKEQDIKIAVALLGKQYKLVYKAPQNKKDVWINFPNSKDFINDFDYEKLKQWMIATRSTIRTKFINTTEGWIKVDKNFNNIWYIPIYFEAPKSDIIQNILTTNSIQSFMQSIEKYLMNSDLIKNEFITVQQMYELVKAATKVLNKHKFYNVLLNSQIDKNLVEKIVIDLFYELTTNKNGDIVKSILLRIFKRSVEIIKVNPTIDKQKNFLIKELNKLFNIFKQMLNIDITKIFSSEEIVKISHDPIKVLTFLNELVDSFDFKKVFSQAKEWMDKYADKQVEAQINNPFNSNELTTNKFTNKISKDNWVYWFLNSIDQKKIKKSLSTLIRNIDFSVLFNLKNKESIITRLITLYVPKNEKDIELILNKIDKYKDRSYKNVKDSLVNIVNNFDLSIFLNEIQKILFENNEYKFTNSLERIKYLSSKDNKPHYQIVPLRKNIIKDEDYIYAFFKAMFNVPGSNREFKKNISEMLNLSDAGRKIDLGNGRSLILPDNDSERLSLLDLINLSNLKIENKTNKTIFNDVTNLKNILNVVLEKINQNKEKVKFEDFGLAQEELLLVKKIFKINTNEELQKNYQTIIAQLLNLNKFFNQFNLRLNHESFTSSSWTIAEWIKYLKDWDGNINAPMIKDIKNLLNFFLKSSTNPDTFGLENISLISFWINTVAHNPYNATSKSSIQFVKDLLNLANDAEIKKIINNKDLDDFSNENIELHESTKLGITIGLVKLQETTKRIFAKDADDKYVLDAINKLIAKYPEINKDDWLKKNKVELIRNLALICANAELTEGVSNPNIDNGLYYYVVENILNNYLSTESFWSVKDIVSDYIYNNLAARVSDYFGINSAIFNSVLRQVFPQFLVYYFANTTKEGLNKKANLQYLLEEKIINFEELANEKKNYKNLIAYDFLISSIKTKYSIKNHEENIFQDGEVLKSRKTLGFDKPFFDKFNIPGDNSFFGIDFPKMINEVLNSILESTPHNEVVYTSPSSYVAKVNHAYLERNNKSIYTGSIQHFTNPIDLEEFLDTLDSKYILNVNGIKFLIVGADTTVDYLYPVVDENNLQTNVSSQALVFLNSEGFDRIRLGYAANAIKNYLLVKNPNEKDKNSDQLKQELQQIIKQNVPNNQLERVYKNTEIDPINPERALRVSTISAMINSVNLISIISISFLVVLIGISTTFIIKRYTSSKYRVLGILVAQGYSPLKIVISFTVFAMVTSIIGGVLGYVIGNRLQLVFLNLFSSYWTLPKEVVNFNIFSLLFTVIVPFISMSLLIIIVSLSSLRHKPIDLISGSAELKPSKVYNKVKKSIKNWNVKRKFSISLIFNGIGKLISFGLSIVLVAVTSMFALANSSVFKNTLNDTYQHRKYTFRADLETPTRESGQYKTFYNSDNQGLQNNLYVPIGVSSEAIKHSYDYFKPGMSSIINSDPTKNGNPTLGDSHILTQFSVNIKVSTGVAIDPWQTAYNSMPDTQKARVDQLRHRVAAELMAFQDGQKGTGENQGYIKKMVIYFYHDQKYPIEYEAKYNENRKYISFVWIKEQEWDLIKNKPQSEINKYLIDKLEKNEVKKAEFFKYVLGATLKESKFVYITYDSQGFEENKDIQTGDDTRRAYREFLIDAYKKIGQEIQIQDDKQEKIQKLEEKLSASKTKEIREKIQYEISQNYSEFARKSTAVLNTVLYPNNQSKFTLPVVNDYFISFGGVYYNPKVDELYSYAKVANTKFGTSNIIYGFNEQNKLVKIVDEKGNDLLAKLLKIKTTNEVYPIIINNVVANKYKVKENDVIDFSIENHVDRYKNKILTKIYDKFNQQYKYKFKVIGISNTHIGNEFVTSREIVNKITGLDSLTNNGQLPFNGVMTKGNAPQQLVGSTSIYSNSGYWSGNDLFNFENMSDSEVKDVFESIFNKDKGILKQQLNLNPDEIMKFISNDKNIQYSDSQYEQIKATQAKTVLASFADVYNQTMYTALGASIYAKSIEVGFTNQIANVAENVITIIIGISFVISIIVLVIISNIIIAENEKNIAIWSILGYNRKEKINMFFTIFVPFIIATIILSVPITYGIIYAFKTFILAKQSISLPIYFNALHIGGAALVIFSIFIITSLLVWLSINKMKPIDLLKGRD
ncbi:FtsX-like permease family protein [Mycoplasmopsis hyopharyngis]|uniref:FtsX-like permease family protein n=1 Tax=Mycoplasmopsis hyopharyngis TaxID=29558 RepID=UPI003872ECA6